MRVARLRSGPRVAPSPAVRRAALLVVLAACLAGSGRQVPLRAPLVPHPPTSFPNPRQLFDILNTPQTAVDACIALSPGTTGEHSDRMRFAIQPDGSVSDIAADGIRSAAAIDCYTRLLASKRYPLPDASTPVDVIVDFNAELRTAWMRAYSLCE